MPLIEFIESFGNNAYSKIKEYEIVQLISASNLERVKEKTKSDSINQTEQGDAEYNRLNEQNKDESPFQVVILHRGSQVLLMNGKIDGKETINPIWRLILVPMNFRKRANIVFIEKNLIM